MTALTRLWSRIVCMTIHRHFHVYHIEWSRIDPHRPIGEYAPLYCTRCEAYR